MHISSKEIFDLKIAPLLIGSTSTDTINIFSKTSFNYFYNLSNTMGLKERQVASIIGFKDEFFVETVINQVIEENNFNNKFYCKKVTANKTSGIKGRSVKVGDKNIDLTFGGDCVVFCKQNNRDIPILIIECKEYIDMIRLKELIGESKIIKDIVSNSTVNFPKIQFWVFAEVLELTEGWAYLFNNSDLKHLIDNVFVVRLGKRKDKTNNPQKDILFHFRDEVKFFLKSYENQSDK